VPAKQTKEAIEAELNASEHESIALQLQEVAKDIDIVEKELRALEDARGIPEFNRSKPLPERMAARGMRQATIERIQHLWNGRRTDLVTLASHESAPID
jgi:hypothetical protein